MKILVLLTALLGTIACGDLVDKCADKAGDVVGDAGAGLIQHVEDVVGDAGAGLRKECQELADEAAAKCEQAKEDTKQWIEDWWRETIDDFAMRSGCTPDPASAFWGWDCRRSSFCNPPDAGP